MDMKFVQNGRTFHYHFFVLQWMDWIGTVSTCQNEGSLPGSTRRRWVVNGLNRIRRLNRVLLCGTSVMLLLSVAHSVSHGLVQANLGSEGARVQ